MGKGSRERIREVSSKRRHEAQKQLTAIVHSGPEDASTMCSYPETLRVSSRLCAIFE